MTSATVKRYHLFNLRSNILPPIFSGKMRRFQANWYTIYPWLEYSIVEDAAYCYPCRIFGNGEEDSGKGSGLVSTGFRHWKNARGKRGTLRLHNLSKAHKNFMLTWSQFKVNTSRNTTISYQMDRLVSESIQKNRYYVKCIIAAILFCAQQGIALRGHRESEELGSELNPGNFKSLVHLLARSDSQLRERLESGPKNVTWLGHKIQNEIISTLACIVTEDIAIEIKEANYFTLIVDETKDVSKKEQISLVIRYVKGGKVHERFTGYLRAEKLDATALTAYVLEGLGRMGLDISNCVSQCYDGASVMSGRLGGVSAKILELNSSAVYIHCCAHRLNLALVDTSKAVPTIADFFVLIEKLYVFIAASSTHSIFLEKQKQYSSTEFRLKKVSDTRWSCRYASIKVISTTFSAILDTLADVAVVIESVE